MYPVISLIIPVYNGGETLSACIDSILTQPFRNYEILLINDGSTDNSAEICNSYLSKDKRIKVIHKSNGGVSSARNYGLDASTGKYVVFLDSDDSVLPGALDRLMTSDDDDLVIGGVRHVVPEYLDGFLNVPKSGKYNVFDDAKELDSLFCQVYVTAPWSKRFKKSIIEKNKLRFDCNLFYGEDTDFVLRYIGKSKNIRTVDSAITRYNDTGISRRTKYNIHAESFIYLAESIYRNIKLLQDKTHFGFSTLDSFLSRYATDMFLDTLTHESKIDKFRLDVSKIRMRKNLLCPSSQKKRFLCYVLIMCIINEQLVIIIVPVYGVGERIRRFADSLFSQTIADKIEFIFVDDATPDHSIDILNEVLNDKFNHLKKRVNILRHDSNKGLPAARNTGMRVARGKYIIHVDSDDYLHPNMIERLYYKCESENLDLAWCDWNIVKGNHIINIKEPEYTTGEDALLHSLIGPLHYNVWNKLIRRRVFEKNNIIFPEGYSMGEDMTIMMILACATRVGKAEGCFYYYVKYDNGSITSQYSDNHIQSLEYNVTRVCDFIHKRWPGKYLTELAFMKLGIKSTFLISGYKPRLFRTWRRLFKEANEYIGRNKQTLTRISFLEKCAKKNLFLPVALYNLLIVDFYNRLR